MQKSDRTGRRGALAILVFGAAYAALVAVVHHSYALLVLTVVPVWAVMGLAWNLISGYSGYISFGHAAFFGLGAYFVALTQIHGSLSPWLGIPGAALTGALAGLVVGVPTFRLRGHYFALGMLAYPLALLYVFEWLGYQEVALPMRHEAALAYMQFTDHRAHAWLALSLMLLAMFVTLKVERSRFGLSLLAIREDEAAAEAAGIRTRVWKLRALMASGALAGAAGGFYAVVLIVVTPPAVFGMLVSAQALIVTMFGGVGTLWGPTLGAVVLVPLGEFLHARLGDQFPGIQGVVFGIAIVTVILLAPEGLYWKVRDLLSRRNSAVPAGRAPGVSDPVPAAAATGRRPPAGPSVLEARGLSKSFGGVRAVRAVDLDIRTGEIVGIIGPNGSGKTTLFNLLNGFLKPDSGHVRLQGRDITGHAPSVICAAGLGRTFQVVRPFRRLSVLDNVTAGAYVHAAGEDQAREAAWRALTRVGLRHLATRPADGLSNKELRLLEIARALAGKPSVMLLDETLAGLGAADVDEVIDVVRALACQGITIVIIEHTMQAMVKLVDRFVVLNEGAVLAQGEPAAVTRDAAVIDAYLGHRWREQDARHP